MSDSLTCIIYIPLFIHAWHCWRSKDELISEVLLWTPTYSRAKAGRPARTYIQQLCEDTRCSPEDLPEAMNDREKWRERVRDIRASGATWWWWWMMFHKKNNPHIFFWNIHSESVLKIQKSPIQVTSDKTFAELATCPLRCGTKPHEWGTQ